MTEVLAPDNLPKTIRINGKPSVASSAKDEVGLMHQHTKLLRDSVFAKLPVGGTMTQELGSNFVCQQMTMELGGGSGITACSVVGQLFVVEKDARVVIHDSGTK